MHKPTVLAIAGCVCLLAAGCATTPMQGAGDQGEGQRVLATEDEWVAAEIGRDEAVLRRVIDDRFVFNANSGKTSGKSDLIRNVLGWKMTGQTVSERTVLVDGETAVVSGTTEMRFASEGGGESRRLLRYTATYVKREGKWRALALQMANREGAK